MQADTPKQGPMYFPMDKVGTTGNDPTFLLNRQNATSTTNLINNQNGSSTTVDGSPNPATGDPDSAEKKKSTRLARTLSILVIVVSVVMFVAGLVNILVMTVPTLVTNYNNTKSFTALQEQQIFVWIWATPGVWASIPPFVAGLALLLSKRTPKKLSANEYNPGLPIELQNSQKNYSNAPDVYRVFAIFSITFCLPVAILLAILDLLLWVEVSFPQKVVLPAIVALAAIVDFILLLLAWYKIKDAADNEYQYIGSTYTIYETYEPLLTKEPPMTNAVTQMTTGQHCCPAGNPTPIVIINQPPVCQPAAPPVNVVVQELEPPRPRPRPRPLPPPMAVPVPVPVPALPRPVSMMPMIGQQQRYYPNRMYGAPPSGFMGRPNAYRGMFLPSSSFGFDELGRP